MDDVSGSSTIGLPFCILADRIDSRLNWNAADELDQLANGLGLWGMLTRTRWHRVRFYLDVRRWKMQENSDLLHVSPMLMMLDDYVLSIRQSCPVYRRSCKHGDRSSVPDPAPVSAWPGPQSATTHLEAVTYGTSAMGMGPDLMASTAMW
jgi:hypothetical protein